MVFVRHVYKNGYILVRQFWSATKLASKKTISIPKFELNTVLIAAQLTLSVVETLTYNNLCLDREQHRGNWIRATAAFYQTFVSNRIGEIQTTTEIDERRFVPGKSNPADMLGTGWKCNPLIIRRWSHSSRLVDRPGVSVSIWGVLGT